MTRIALLSALSLLMFGFFGTVQATETLEERYYGNRIIVKMKSAEGEGKTQPTELTPDKMSAMAEGKRYTLRQLKRTKLGSSVLQLSNTPTPEELERLATEIDRRDDVEYAHVDYKRYPAAFSDGTPDDTFFDRQWYLQGSDTNPGATNVNAAWSPINGSGIVIAIVDTGYTRHNDFNLGSPARVLNTYDFISLDSDGTSSTAGDNDGPDNDASDIGDRVTQTEKDNNPVFRDDPACTPSDSSSWHGTQVAGIINASTDDGTGIAGVAPGSFVLMYRALGKCGGYISDIMDAALNAAGIPIPELNLPGTAESTTQIINLSLGGDGACTPTEGDAIWNIVKRGVVVVTAAGNYSDNEGGDANTSAPGNCTGTINVAANTRLGGETAYTKTGTYVDIAAPGGNNFADGCDTDGNGIIDGNDDSGNAVARAECNTGIITTSHDLVDLAATGETTWKGTSTSIPSSAYVTSAQGTSFSAPIVSGIIALMLHANDSLTPEDVYSILQESARGFPADAPDAPRTCTTETCGAGIIDAAAAVSAAESSSFTRRDFPIKSNTPGGSGGASGSGEPFFGATGKGGGGGSAAPLLPLALLVLFGWRRARS